MILSLFAMGVSGLTTRVLIGTDPTNEGFIRAIQMLSVFLGIFYLLQIFVFKSITNRW